MAEPWILILYRAPSEPSTARVTIWRRLHKLGAIYVGPSACLLPARLEAGSALHDAAEALRQGGGSLDTYTVEAFAQEAEASLEARYNAARDAEYAEIVERAEGVVQELELEGSRGKYTYAEVEENETALARLRRLLRRIRGRDIFGATGRPSAQAAVARAEERLEEFVDLTASREGQNGGPPIPHSAVLLDDPTRTHREETDE